MHVFSLVVERNEPPVEILVAELSPDQSLEDLFEGIYKTADSTARLRSSIIVVRPPVKWPLDPLHIQAIVRGQSVPHGTDLPPGFRAID
jgi:hypothetical protein